MDRVATLTEQIRDWYDHSPKAQHVNARLAADVSAVGAWAEPKARELWGRVAPFIDPPPKPAADGRGSPERQAGPGAS